MGWQEFLAMGGHGFYVWSSFGIVTLVMLINAVIPVARERRLLQNIRDERQS